MDKSSELKCIFIGLVILCLSGCLNMGPSTIARDRFDYAAAISESWKDQLLLNIVKLRYADAPIFLDVASITNQYSFERQVELSALWANGLTGDSQGFNGSGKYTDRPTITYSPLMGEKFKSSMLRPIPPEELLGMVQSGWDVEYAFRLCVQAINGIDNRSGKLVDVEGAERQFYALIKLLGRIQQEHALGFRAKVEERGSKFVLFFNRKKRSPVADEIKRAKMLLGLNPDKWEFTLSYGAIQHDPDDIAMLTRSMLQILLEMASQIEVPSAHLDENRAAPVQMSEVSKKSDIRPLMQIKSQIDEPADAFVRVRYRDYWFWIDDRDFLSKRTFSFLMFLFSLAETGSPEYSPVLTIPAG